MGGKHSLYVADSSPDKRSSAKQSIKAKISMMTTSKMSMAHSKTLKKGDELVVRIMMPLYFLEDAVRFQDVYDAKISWEKIMNNQTGEFYTQNAYTKHKNSREWFESLFYERLFDVHPFCKKMFKNPSSQGKFLVALFSFIFTVLDNEEEFNSRLRELAESHSKRGVKATEYAIIGEVMFWTLRQCLGVSYDAKTHTAWVKIFSKMLKIIVPISVSYELEDDSIQVDRVRQFLNGITPTTRRTKGASVCPFLPSDDCEKDIQNPSKSIYVGDSTSLRA